MPNFRDLAKKITPRWLHAGYENQADGDGGPALFVAGLLIDASLERLLQGVRARMPQLADPSALYKLSRDRKIVRAPTEPATDFAARLIEWREPKGHKVRGTPFALLTQIRAFAQGAVKLRTVDARGNWYTLDSSTDPEESHLSNQGNWDWDALAVNPNWARFWGIVYAVAGDPWAELPVLGDSTAFGGAKIGSNAGVTFGSSMTKGEADALRSLPVDGEWKPAGTQAEWLMVAFTALFDPSAPEPDGTWDRWQNRNVNSLYLAWEASKATAGDPNNYPTNITLPDGSDKIRAYIFNLPADQLIDRTSTLVAVSTVVTATGSYVLPADAVAVRVVAVGGGGGGSGRITGVDDGGGGGGGGSLASGTWTATALGGGGTSLSITVGAGGAGGGDDSDGTDGGDTIVSVASNEILRAHGGLGGTGSNGNGGSAVGGGDGSGGAGNPTGAGSPGSNGRSVRVGAGGAGGGSNISAPSAGGRFMAPGGPAGAGGEGGDGGLGYGAGGGGAGTAGASTNGSGGRGAGGYWTSSVSAGDGGDDASPGGTGAQGAVIITVWKG